MFAVISPAKRLDCDPAEPGLDYSQPTLIKETQQLATTAKALSPKDLSQLMKLSETLTSLNYDRFQAFSTPFTPQNAKQAVKMFMGDTYRGLDAATLSGDDLDYAQGHLGILSGFYGMLRPLDLIQPYRLEMGTRLANIRGKNLYTFWGSLIAQAINTQMAEHGSATLINLASKEYFRSIDRQTLQNKVIAPVFKETRNGQTKIIGLMAKVARGKMARHIIQGRLHTPESLKGYDEDGYDYKEALSTENEWVFVR